MSIDQNVLLHSRICFWRPYPHHVPFLLVSGRQQALDKKRIMNMLVGLATHHLHLQLWMEWGAWRWIYYYRRTPCIRSVSYTIAEGGSRHWKISFFPTEGSYPRVLIHRGLMARALHNQVGPPCTESWCAVWNLNSVKLGTIIASFVYILSHDLFLH